MLIDTHCHLDQPPLLGQLGSLLHEARAVGIARWLVPSLHPEGWSQLADLSRQLPELRPAYGIHPQFAANVTISHLQQLEQVAPDGVAIGEIGLDATYGELQRQEWLFREQIRIARHHGLPLLIHCRRAIGRTLTILREEKAAEVGGIMHAFSGSLESAQQCIKLGFVLSICGNITRSNAVRLRQLARSLPLEHLVVETDAPDMTPEQYRGHYNRPVWLLEVVAALARIRACPITTVVTATTATAQRVIPKL